MKIFSMVLNVLLAFFVGALAGLSIIVSVVMWLFYSPTILSYFSNQGFNFLAISILVICGIMFVSFELKPYDNRIILFFQRKVLRKILLICGILLIFVCGFYFPRQIHKLRYTAYEKFAGNIVALVSNSVSSGNMAAVISNELDIDYLLVVGGYDIPRKELSDVWRFNDALINEIEKKNPRADGVYIHLIKSNKVVSVKSFTGRIDIEGKYLVTRCRKSINIYLQNVPRKDFANRVYESVVIYKIE